MDWRDCAINALAAAMSTRESLINTRLRWCAPRLTMSAVGEVMPSDPREERGAPSPTAARLFLRRPLTRALSRRACRRTLWTVTRHAVQARQHQRCEVPRHGCVTPGADTIADLERHQGRHPGPGDMLLTQDTDDLERGKAVIRASKLAWLTLYKLSLCHHLSPLPTASGRRRL